MPQERHVEVPPDGVLMGENDPEYKPEDDDS